MTEIVINRKELCNAIEDVLLKGKYKGASKSKVDLIDANVACLIKAQQIVLANASHSIAATVSVNCETGLESVKDSQWLFFDAEKAIKYLKAMKDEIVKLNSSNGSLEIVGTSSMKMPLSIEHSGLNGIAKLMTVKMEHGLAQSSTATFSSTKFETMVMFEDSKDFARAIKECSVVGTAAYQLDYSNNELTISSTNFQRTETYSTKVEITTSSGEPVRIEFSAPLDKFCRGPLWLFLKEESPILLIGPDRKLIVAPYIRGE